MLLKYYLTIPWVSGDEQIVRNYVYFFKTSFEKGIFFGLLRVPLMTLPGQPVFLVSMVFFLSFFKQNFRNKWKFTHTNFPVQWMKIMRDITLLHELSEQPTYQISWCNNN